ncbi:hypothetical protein ACFQU7_08385 [Pseudoroseomonas wenyumeiae]
MMTKTQNGMPIMSQNTQLLVLDPALKAGRTCWPPPSPVWPCWCWTRSGTG